VQIVRLYLTARASKEARPGRGVNLLSNTVEPLESLNNFNTDLLLRLRTHFAAALFSERIECKKYLTVTADIREVYMTIILWN